MNATDVVVVFGAAVGPDGAPSPALRRRVVAAVRWAGDRDVIFLVTGGIVRFPPIQSGVPRERITMEDQARSTLESARLCAPLIAGLQPERIFACSDGYHVPRCRWLLRLMGLRTLPINAQPEHFTFWRYLREMMALPVDTLCWLLRI
jgi:vancomycin permeability regulator SanA